MAGPSLADLIPQTELYNADVYTRYQSTQRMGNVMVERVNQGAGTFVDRIGGKTEMTEIPFGAAQLTTSAVNFTEVNTTPLRFVIKTAIAEADQAITNVDVREQHALVHGKAAGRMVDILKLNAIFNNPAAPIADYPTIGKIAGTPAGLTSKRLIQIRNKLNGLDVEMDKRSVIANSDAYISLFEDERYTESFYVGPDRLPLPNGAMKPYLGMPLVELAGQASNSIPQIENVGPPISFDSHAIVMQYEAMKMQFVTPIRTVISYDEQNLNFVIVTELVANAQVIQQNGVGLIELQLDENGDPVVVPPAPPEVLAPPASPEIP